MCKVVELCWRTSKHTEAESNFFWLGTGQSKREVGLGQRSSLACGEIYQKKKKKNRKKKYFWPHQLIRGLDHRKTDCPFLALHTISVSLGKTSICLLWRARVYIFRNIQCGCAEISSSITISLTEGKVLGCLAVQSLSQWKQEKKKTWNLFTSWLLCRSAIVILSLITSNAFCHLLVTNLHLADYQRRPNQWVIGVEDCGDNPGNESTEKT